MSEHPTFVIKRNTKRPTSGLHALADLDPDMTWISELHRLWKTPLSRRGVGPGEIPVRLTA